MSGNYRTPHEHYRLVARVRARGLPYRVAAKALGLSVERMRQMLGRWQRDSRFRAMCGRNAYRTRALYIALCARDIHKALRGGATVATPSTKTTPTGALGSYE